MPLLASSSDPRIQRTRQLLRQSLLDLLWDKSFDDISVQDIADRSTVNRATFYDHYTDKFALLDDLIEQCFLDVLTKKQVPAKIDSPEDLRQIMLAVCDYLHQLNTGCTKHQRQFAPIVEAKVKSIIRSRLLAGMTHPRKKSNVPPSLTATIASWSIYGAALEWSLSHSSLSAEAFTKTVLPLILAGLHWHEKAQTQRLRKN